MINQSIKNMIAVIICTLLTPLAHAAVAGHYYLHDITEVGSELLLNPDGNYQAILMYGAVDMESSGTWQQKDNSIELHSTETQQTLFKDLKLILQQDKLYPQGSPLDNGYYQKE